MGKKKFSTLSKNQLRRLDVTAARKARCQGLSSRCKEKHHFQTTWDQRLVSNWTTRSTTNQAEFKTAQPIQVRESKDQSFLQQTTLFQAVSSAKTVLADQEVAFKCQAQHLVLPVDHNNYLTNPQTKKNAVLLRLQKPLDKDLNDNEKAFLKLIDQQSSAVNQNHQFHQA